jgi:hypothetical protein
MARKVSTRASWLLLLLLLANRLKVLRVVNPKRKLMSLALLLPPLLLPLLPLLLLLLLLPLLPLLLPLLLLLLPLKTS